MTISFNPAQSHAKTPAFGIGLSSSVKAHLGKVLRTGPKPGRAKTMVGIEKVGARWRQRLEKTVNDILGIKDDGMVLEVVSKNKSPRFFVKSLDGRSARVTGRLSSLELPRVKDIEAAADKLNVVA